MPGVVDGADKSWSSWGKSNKMQRNTIQDIKHFFSGKTALATKLCNN